MNTLDSPLEALAFNYLSYGILTAVNNIWAWVAVVTAAVSFWRIRAPSPPPVSRTEQLGGREVAALTTHTLPEMLDRDTADADEPAQVSTPAQTNCFSAPKKTSHPALERENSTKEKFILYYREDDVEEVEHEGADCEDDGGGDGGGTVANEKLECLCDDWKRMMVVRMGDMGWHRYQDLTMLDGNVVRLWDRCNRSPAASLTAADGGVV